MHIMKECFMSYQVAFAIPKTSIYKKRFDEVIRKLSEAGLVAKWFRDEMDKAAKVIISLIIPLKSIYIIGHLQVARSTRSETAASPLTLEQLQAPLYLWIFTTILSLICFSLEVVYTKVAKIEQQ